MADTLLEDLRGQIAAGTLLVVVGAGVSVGATGVAATASWTGLLHHGVDRVEAITQGALPPGWGQLVRQQIHSGYLPWLLEAAEEITEQLGGRSGGEYRRWLRESVGALTIQDSAVIEALAGLGVPIATTNYDGLIEDATGWPAVTWRDGARVQLVLRGDEQAVVHLHGHWQDPESVVLGIRSYEAVLKDAAAQALQRAMGTLRSLLFVGFGAGLADPNFSALRTWLGDTFPSGEYRHFRLCRQEEVEQVVAQHSPNERVMVLPYGVQHHDMAPFLRSLIEPGQPAVSPPSGTGSEALIEALNILVSTFVTDYEFVHLCKFLAGDRFPFVRGETAFFFEELRRLRSLGLINGHPGKGVRTLDREGGDVKNHFFITERGKAYLKQRIEALNLFVSTFVTDYEFVHLRKFLAVDRFPFVRGEETAFFFEELRRLRSLGLIDGHPGKGVRTLDREGGDVKNHFFITERGKAYLKLRDQY